MGPAFIASIAYMDPGNFATNIQGGAQFGYLLVWVIVASNLMAMLIQSLSAKLGIATGMNWRRSAGVSVPQACSNRHVGRFGNRRHGDRPRRVPWRGYRLSVYSSAFNLFPAAILTSHRNLHHFEP